MNSYFFASIVNHTDTIFESIASSTTDLELIDQIRRNLDAVVLCSAQAFAAYYDICDEGEI